MSIIIPTYNERRNLGRCLDALSRSSVVDLVEVLIIDNGSTDGTIAFAEGYASRLNLQIATYPKLTVGALRNRGVEMSRGGVVCFLDADCEAAADWVEQAIELNRTRGGIVGSMYSVCQDASWVAKVWARHERRPRSGNASFVPGGNLVISRSDFDAAGGFDETLRSNEDFEFCRRAASRGIGVQDCGSLIVRHFGAPQTLGSLWQQQQRHGRDVFKVFCEHITQGWNLRTVLYAAYILLAITALIISGIVAAVSGEAAGVSLSAAALIAAPVALSTLSVYRNRRWHDLFPLAILFFVYGISRGVCLFNFRASRDVLRHRRA